MSLLQQRIAMYNANAFKIGLFGANCSSSRTATLVPERWRATWGDCQRLAKEADVRGIDFMLPIGRWKGYGGESDFHGSTFETITWACGLLAATRRITVFGTVHAPLFHPLIAAKQIVTADQIGEGRFGLNIVAGWNEGEFEMFGVEQREHDQRYAFAEEWLEIMRRAWSPEHEQFDFHGQAFDLAGVRAKPKTFGGTRPAIMNAGSSGAGRAFAIRNCDAFFTSTIAARLSGEGGSQHDSNELIAMTARMVDGVKAEARGVGREIEVYTQGQVICRPTQREAEEYHHYANVECADWPAVEQMLALRGVTRENTTTDEYAAKRRMQAVSGIGGTPYVGSPDRIAGMLANLAGGGVRGVALSFVNYLDELPYFCDEVLPRLQRMGLRQATAAA